MESEQTIKQ